MTEKTKKSSQFAGFAPNPGIIQGKGSFEPYEGTTELPAIKPTKERLTPYMWKSCSVADLVRFRDEITDALPTLELSKMNLEEETLLQYHTLRALQGNVMDDEEVPVNQRTQVANSIGSTLRALGDQQVALYSSERFKQIENLLIRTLDKLPEDLAAEFIEAYGRILDTYVSK